MRSEYIFREEMKHVLAALSPENRLACEISLATGMRIGDVLKITRKQAEQGRFTYYESKTGKARRVRLPVELQQRCNLYHRGSLFVFPSRLNAKKTRTRQAVYKDLRRAADLFRIKQHISPHSMRKIYAVDQYHKTGDLKRVQSLLNHDHEATTMLYAMADLLTTRRLGRKPSIPPAAP